MVLHCGTSIPVTKPLLTFTHRRKPKPKHQFSRKPSKFSCLVANIGVDDIVQLAHNKVLVAAAASAAIGQLSKPFTSVLLYGKDFDFKSAFQAGGFPSTHSSVMPLLPFFLFGNTSFLQSLCFHNHFKILPSSLSYLIYGQSVVAAATSLALERGFSDSIFGVTLVYAGLIMYDAQVAKILDIVSSMGMHLWLVTFALVQLYYCSNARSLPLGVRREVGNHARALNTMLPKVEVNSVVYEDRDNLIDSREKSSERLSPILSKKSSSSTSKNANVPVLIASEKETRQTKEAAASFEFAANDYEGLEGDANYHQVRLKESIGHTEVEVIAGALLGFVVSLAVYSIIM
ncbi:hypothetical protein CXB51_020774 [Gossypium anomalum]|uniref:Acid phosphatase/vanadium-dependent haloperoxidase-related protein n=1 Tax=Gossypium anomalum TaxID=47600 RepID=A0A8J5YBW3_9ROSI|nr:hypothetical protein CXB51_020774 [Gossypium anomalum]